MTHYATHGFLDERAVARRLLQRWYPAGYQGTAVKQGIVGDKAMTWVRFDYEPDKAILVSAEDLQPIQEPARRTALERILEDG